MKSGAEEEMTRAPGETTKEGKNESGKADVIAMMPLRHSYCPGASPSISFNGRWRSEKPVAEKEGQSLATSAVLSLSD